MLVKGALVFTLRLANAHICHICQWTGSISWLLMPWLLALPACQQLWNWLYEMEMSFCFLDMNLNSQIQLLRNDLMKNTPLQWHHNECNDVSKHRCLDCFLSRCSGADQRKHQSSASLAFVRGIHRWPVDSLHKGPVMWKCFHLMTSSCIFVSSEKLAHERCILLLLVYFGVPCECILCFPCKHVIMCLNQARISPVLLALGLFRHGSGTLWHVYSVVILITCTLNHGSTGFRLTHWPLVMPYGNINFGQRWLR